MRGFRPRCWCATLPLVTEGRSTPNLPTRGFTGDSQGLATSPVVSSPRGYFVSPGLAADCARFLIEARRQSDARAASMQTATRFR